MNKEINLFSDNIKRFNIIIQKYKNGEFGNNHMSLQQILEVSGEKDLLDNMTEDEVKYLVDNSCGVTKMLFLELLKQKTKDENNDLDGFHLIKKNRFI